MLLLILGLVLFLGTHSISIFARGWRDQMVARFGEWGWKGIYSVASLLGFWLIVRGYADARLTTSVLYVPPTWLRRFGFLVLLPVFPLLLAAYMPGRIKTKMKHPMLNAVKFWATAHLMMKGSVASTVLYGAFLIWASADRVSLKYRPPREPKFMLPPNEKNDTIALAAGLAIYAAMLIFGHRLLIGIQPVP